MRPSQRDWWEWHRPYDEPGSFLARRLDIVQQRVREALDRCRPGAIRAVSMCAGQGRDLIGVLVEHPRRHDVTARLVELDPRNVRVARAHIRAAGITGIEVFEGDASPTDVYDGFVPADLVLVCGVFGNISAADIQATIHQLPTLCAAGATVIWTRHRLEPDITPTIRLSAGRSSLRAPRPPACPAGRSE